MVALERLEADVGVDTAEYGGKLEYPSGVRYGLTVGLVADDVRLLPQLEHAELVVWCWTKDGCCGKTRQWLVEELVVFVDFVLVVSVVREVVAHLHLQWKLLSRSQGDG